jgi:DNA adenine methylase
MLENDLCGGVYAEPYAGGAGVALDLLFSGYAKHIYINDLDPNIYAFWYSMLHDTNDFLSLLATTEATIENWYLQRAILAAPEDHASLLERGFATFFLNRCNRSGIIKAGPIGGKKQSGRWKIGARYHHANLAHRIEVIASYRDAITVTNEDCLDFLREKVPVFRKQKSLVYLDPPYYEKGRSLYLNAYEPTDHAEVSSFLHTEFSDLNWIISYDVCYPIAVLYGDFRCTEQILNYSISATRRKGKEFVFYAPSLKVPCGMPTIDPLDYLTARNEKSVENSLVNFHS